MLRKNTEVRWSGGRMWRPGSPSPGGSTLMTSAPWSASAVREIRPRQEPGEIDDLQSFELHVRLPSRVSLSAPSGEQAAWAGRSPSMRRGLAMTRRLPFTGCGTAETMPVVAREGAVERLVEAVDRRGRQEAVECASHSAVVRVRKVGSSASVSAARLDGARVGIGEARVAQKVLAAHRLDQRQPELLGHAHDEDPAVLGREGLDRRQRQMRAARHARRDIAFVEVPDAGIGELVHGDVVQAGLDVAALPRRLGAQAGRPAGRRCRSCRSCCRSARRRRASARPSGSPVSSISPASACIRKS